MADYDPFFDDVVSDITGRPMHYDKQGNPISLRQMGNLKFNFTEPGEDGYAMKSDYARIGSDTVGDAWVSTVWLGMDHGFWMDRNEEYKPVIFETMVFGGEHDQWQARYCTEEEAIAGHRMAVDDLRMGMRPGWSLGGEDEDAWSMTHEG